MNSKRFFYIMCAILFLSIAGGAAMLYYANGMLKKRSSNVVELKLENRELEEQQSAYQAAKANVEKYSYLNDIIGSALPQDKDQAQTVREISALAAQSGIKIKSIAFPASTLGKAVAPPAAAPAAGATTTPATPAVPAAPVAPTITQAKPVDGLKGVYSIETTVTPFSDGKTYKVSYAQLIDFLSRIESNRRAMQVANIQITPLGSTATDSINFTLTLNIFIKP